MFKSIVWSSTIDYPKQVSTVLFVGICNWDCGFCYNRNLINNKDIDFDNYILPRLIQRKKFINHIVISGGEVTCYNELINVIDKLKNKGFTLGIHTNGSNPDMLENIIDKIDFVGMDIKTSFTDKYNKITNKIVNFEDLEKSIKTIINSNKLYEFRTTLYPKYVNLNDCLFIAEKLKSLNVNKYVLQQYENSFNNENNKNKINSYPVNYIKQIREECNKIILTELKGW